MSSKSKRIKRPTPIDPLFRVPTGAEEEFTFSRDNNDVDFGPAAYADGRSAISTPFGVFFDSSSPSSVGNYLATPNNLIIYDQKIRRADGGVVVVDIVAQFDEVPGAQRYEIRLTKV